MTQCRANRATSVTAFLLITGLLFCALYFTNLPQLVRSAPPPPPPPPAKHDDAPVKAVEKPAPAIVKPIVDNFPSLGESQVLPPLPSYNAPPSIHVAENTTLFIGFTRNWPLLQQTVVSYIAAGWPPSDIHVIDNSGTMNSNRLGKLSLQNPFYLNTQRLEKVFGIKVVETPALLSFAQLQNFFMSYALANGWDTYFWGHMDVAVLPAEEYVDPKTGQFKNFYTRAVEEMRATLAPDFGKWAIRFYAYDRLALVNLASYMDVGGWDALIPYYMTDCDFHERLYMAEYTTVVAEAGRVFDIGSPVEDLRIFFRPEAPADLGASESSATLNSSSYYELLETLKRMEKEKNTPREGGRNVWQVRQQGGEGEPFYRDSDGFQIGLEMMIESGREIYRAKWGHRDCDLRESGRVASKAWRYEKDYDTP